MNLNALRHIQLLHGGQVRAWALRLRSFYRITEELGYPEAEWSKDSTIFDVPVVLVRPGEPEGAIV